jgi:uncharacterized protein (TIGR01244 family)
MVRQLDNDMFVSGQIAPEDMPALAARGFLMIINNRPDGEVPGQPRAEEIGAAAQAAGIAYRAIPVRQLEPGAVEAMGRALDEAEGPALAFCAAGTRSTYLWALAQSAKGADADALVQKALGAGVDLTPIRRFLR